MVKELSVIIAALDTYNEVREVYDCIDRQTIRDRLEIIFICKTRKSLFLPDSFLYRHPDVVFIEGGESILLHQARHLGILRSTTPYVVIMEDHCLPLNDCLEHMLGRLKEGWSGVGPAIRNGNKVSKIAKSANYVTYGEWMGREASGEVKYIAGYNSAFSRAVLISRREKLQEDLVATSLMQKSLRKQGHKFFLETRSVMLHWEASCWGGTKRILIPNGQALGALRSRRWNFLKRLSFSFLIPCLFMYRYLRAVYNYLRAVKFAASIIECCYLFPISLIWSFAELKGYWKDGQEVFEAVSTVERNRTPLIRPEDTIASP